jgi:endonuclease I
MGDSLSEWLNELVSGGILLAALGGGFVLADDGSLWALHEELEVNEGDDFDDAKEHLYNDVDLEGDGRVRCRYSNSFVTLVDQGHRLWPSSEDGVQVEHTWASAAKWDTNAQFPRDSVPGADLHHLFPVRRGINGSRGNHPFGELPAHARELAIDPDGTLEDSAGTGQPSGSYRDRHGDTVLFEPPTNHKGDVARAMFYMSVRYWWPIPENMEEDLRQWHEDDPPTPADLARNDRIEAIQHNRNPFVDTPELVDDIEDF